MINIFFSQEIVETTWVLAKTSDVILELVDHEL